MKSAELKESQNAHMQVWIDKRLGEARRAHPHLTDAVTNHIKDLLEGHLSNRSLSRTEIKDIATASIAKMATPSALGTESDHED